MAPRQTLADNGRKHVYCPVEGIGEEVWHWTPGARIMGVFSQLCNERQIGRRCFLSRGLPVDFEIDDLVVDEDRPPPNANAGQLLIIDEIAFHLAENEAQATHEILVVHRDDAKRLKAEAAEQRRVADSLRDRMLAELWTEMAEFIEAEPQQTLFVFAREL